jgi:hypothetical protein
MKKRKHSDSIESIHNKVATAKRDRKDFSFSIAEKNKLVEQHGIEVVCQTLIQAIRDTGTLVIDPLDINALTNGNARGKLEKLIARVEKEAEKEHPTDADWAYKLGKELIQHKSTLLSFSSSGSMLSTFLNGHLRYTQRVKKGARTPEENWNDDSMLEKAIRYNCLNKVKRVKEALSRNRLRVFCMQGNGCHYGTAFPISAVLWILKREAQLRPDKKLHTFLDPCAGWGDRLAGALIAGKDVVENYVGIDPWNVSNESCRNIYQLLSSEDRCTAEFLQKGAQDSTESWPDADLVFTSPPYAKLECYNVDYSKGDVVPATEAGCDDQQAWRLCERGDDAFVSEFLSPMLKNATSAIRKRNGRIIINIGNTSKSSGGEHLTRDLLETAESIGLKCVETFGMRLSVRAPKTTYEHGAPVLRGEPFFVFQLKNNSTKVVKEKVI